MNKSLQKKIVIGLAAVALVLSCRNKSGGSSARSTTLPMSSRLKGPQRVLIIGDSVSSDSPPKVEYIAPFGGSPGHVLAKLLTNEGATVLINAIGGRSAAGFIAGSTCTKSKKVDGKKVCIGLKEPGRGEAQIKKIAQTFNPQTAILLLGINDAANMAVGGSEKGVLIAFDKIVKALQAEGIKVIIVGPPSFSNSFNGEKQNIKFDGGKIEATSAKLAKDLATRYPDIFINSRPLTDDLREPSEGRAKDKIHFYGKAATKWATRVFNQITGV